MMIKKSKLFFLILSFLLFSNTFSQNLPDNTHVLTIAVDSNFSEFDTIATVVPDSNAEKLRVLMYDALVRRNEKLEYVGELAKEIRSQDNSGMIEFILRENIKFHDGKILNSADVKYTLETLLKKGGFKSSSFYDVVNGEKKPHILGIETPAAQTVHIKLARASLKNQLLSNLISIPIISEGSKINDDVFKKTVESPPNGTGAYKFVRFDESQQIVELTAHQDYWQGSPLLQNIQIKAVTDVERLISELKLQKIDLAPMHSDLSPDEISRLSQEQNLKIEQFKGSNIRHLTFNTQAKPLNDVKVRQAIAYAINREKIINELLSGQARIAHSILPETSWAYTSGTIYDFNPAKALSLLKEAGLRDKNGDGRFDIKPIVFKIPAGNPQVSQFSLIIAQSLKKIGLTLEIELVEMHTLIEAFRRNDYQMTTSVWVSGNQDPNFLFDLFASSEFPEKNVGGRNRSRYANKEVDTLLSQAIRETDSNKAKRFYIEAQEIISRDIPLFPLWHPANVVVANKKIGNIKVRNTGDWSFIKDLTLLK